MAHESSIRVDTVEEVSDDDNVFESLVDDADYESDNHSSWDVYNFEEHEAIQYNIPTPKKTPQYVVPSSIAVARINPRTIVRRIVESAM